MTENARRDQIRFKIVGSCTVRTFQDNSFNASIATLLTWGLQAVSGETIDHRVWFRQVVIDNGPHQVGQAQIVSRYLLLTATEVVRNTGKALKNHTTKISSYCASFLVGVAFFAFPWIFAMLSTTQLSWKQRKSLVYEYYIAAACLGTTKQPELRFESTRDMVVHFIRKRAGEWY